MTPAAALAELARLAIDPAAVTAGALQRPAAGPAWHRAARAPVERVEVLLGGLQAAAEEIEGLRGVVHWLSRCLVLGVALAERERRGEIEGLRATVGALARRYREAAEGELLALQAAEALADRAVVAEARLDLVRAALPALRAAATRRELAALVTELAKAIGGGR